MDTWVSVNGEQHGPFTDEHVQGMLARGQLPPDAQVYSATTGWRPAARTGATGTMAPPAPVTLAAPAKPADLRSRH